MRRGNRKVLQDVSGCIRKSRIIGLWGPNGSGKTTLLEILSNWQTPDCGHVEWASGSGGRPVLIPAHATQMLFPWYRLSRNLEIFKGLAVTRGNGKATVNKQTEDLVPVLGLDGLMDRYPHELSSGEQARVALLCGLAFRPSVLMLDEVFAHIDWNAQQEAARTLRQIFESDGNISIVLVSHGLSPLLRLATEVWAFKSGRIRITDPNSLMKEMLTSLQGDPGGSVC